MTLTENSGGQVGAHQGDALKSVEPASSKQSNQASNQSSQECGARKIQARRVSAGIAGAGVFGSYHAQKYQSIDNVDLTAVFDPDEARAKEMAARFNIAAFQDFSKFLEAVDAVSVTSPAMTHFDVAQRALRLGKHCLVEKPLAMSAEEGDALIDLATASGAVLQVGHQERFVAEVFGLFERGRDAGGAHFTRRGKPSGRGEDVSVVMDLMIHDLDLARQFGFGEPVAVEARGDDHDVTADLFFEQGRRLRFSASRRADAQERCVDFDHKDNPVRFCFVGRKLLRPCGEELPLSVDLADQALTDPLGFGVARFVDAAAGVSAPAITGADARDALHWANLIEAARLSGSFVENPNRAVA